jgi:hypothetical protein
VRLDSQGNPDASLGPNGVREVELPGVLVNSSIDIGAMALTPDDHIVIGGSSESPAVTRLTPDGAPDPEFGVDGIAQVYSPLGPSNGGGVLIDNAGRIILGGTTRELHERAQVTAFRTDTNPPDDLDADGTPTAQDHCPGLFGTRDGCPQHRRKVTIRQTRKGLTGTVSSRWVGCVATARVNVFANVNGRDPRVAKARLVGGIDPVDAGQRAFTDWVVKKLPAAETLYAVVRPTDDPATGLCSLATSRPLTIR